MPLNLVVWLRVIQCQLIGVESVRSLGSDRFVPLIPIPKNVGLRGQMPNASSFADILSANE